MNFPPAESSASKPNLHPWKALLFALSAVLLAFHFVHLSADFPNFSPWMDWSKYTDEGWYGDAAIRHFQLGHWYVAGDFNPASALPVWPFLEALVFRFTGVSLDAARALTGAVFGGILLASYALIRRWTTHPEQTLSAEAGVLLLASSPFCFVFTRLAILEPMLILLTMLSLLAAGSVRPGSADPAGQPWRDVRVNLAQITGLGVLLPLLVLTKTTGLFLVPAIAFLLLAAAGYRLGTFLRVGVPAAALGCALWFAYFWLAVRPHYLLDFHYLFAANAYTRISLSTAASVMASTVRDGLWMGKPIYVAALACMGAALLSARSLRRHPLIPALLLWALGYVAFLAYHSNLQPRYYLVVAVPLTLLVPVTLDQLILSQVSGRRLRRWASAALLVALAAVAGEQSRQMVGYALRPEYTLLHAARQVREVIAGYESRHPEHSPLVLSISGSDLSLMTGLPSICDDFGTLELVDRVRLYRPGWYVAWNKIEDDKMDALTPFYSIERVAEFPAMDDPDRDLLIVYRLDDAHASENPAEKPKSTRHKPPPRSFRTRVGQQPSTEQLEH